MERIIIFSRFGSVGLADIALKTARNCCPMQRVVYLYSRGAALAWDDSFDLTEPLDDAMGLLSRNDGIYGPNNKWFEKICLARWKVLLDWMDANKENRVCHCDSDVLLFGDPFETPHAKRGPVLLSEDPGKTWAASCSIVTRDVVNDVWAKAVKCSEESNEHLQNINDMVLWNEFAASNPNVVDQNQTIDGVAWDHHMGCVGEGGGGWEEDPEFNGYKKIQWIDQKPHCLHVPTGKLVRFVNLHCWGDSEFKMEAYAKLGGVPL